MADISRPSRHLERVVFRAMHRNRRAADLACAAGGFHFPGAGEPTSTASGNDRLAMDYLESSIDWRDFGYCGKPPMRKVVRR